MTVYNGINTQILLPDESAEAFRMVMYFIDYKRYVPLVRSLQHSMNKGMREAGRQAGSRAGRRAGRQWAWRIMAVRRCFAPNRVSVDHGGIEHELSLRNMCSVVRHRFECTTDTFLRVF